jgi:regulator of cell morphogenesis and NO signaling
MTTLSVDRSVGQCVAEQPRLASVFQRLGIDYCWAVHVSLQEACLERGLHPETAIRVLLACDGTHEGEAHGHWSLTTMTQLMEHLRRDHHGFLRAELPRISLLFGQLLGAAGESHSEFAQARRVYETLRAQLEANLAHEERDVFPMLRRLESMRTSTAMDGLEPRAVIERLRHDHAEIGHGLQQLRTLLHEYQTQPGVEAVPAALAEALRELEADLVLHIHEENNILFEKALRTTLTLPTEVAPTEPAGASLRKDAAQQPGKSGAT